MRSGTVLIESALYALNIAPGLRRNFSAENWDQIDASVWKKEKERAQDLIRRDARFQGRGFDIDGAAVSLTIANAKKAGVIGCIQAEKRDIRDFKRETETGVVICNPPYGERLLDIKQAEELYQIMGSGISIQNMAGVIPLLLPIEMFEQCYGRKADKEENYIMV